jgi:hypothetical protein
VKISPSFVRPVIALAFLSGLTACAGSGGSNTPAALEGSTLGSAARAARPQPNATGVVTNELYFGYQDYVHQIDLTGKPGNEAKKYGDAPVVGLAVDRNGAIYEAFGDPAHGVTGGISILDPGGLAVIRTFSMPSNLTPFALAVDAREESYVACSFVNDPTKFVIELVMSSDGPNDVHPNRLGPGSNPTSAQPTSLAIDAAGNAYMSVIATATEPVNGILIYSPGKTGVLQLVRVISGPATGITSPRNITLGADGNLYVANQTSSGYDVLVFPVTAKGNVAPVRTLQSGAYGATIGLGANGELYLGPGASANQGIAVFAPGASGNDAPTGFVGKPFTGGNFPNVMTLQNAWYENWNGN